jgi:hypothetical protein
MFCFCPVINKKCAFAAAGKLCCYDPEKIRFSQIKICPRVKQKLKQKLKQINHN